MVMGDSFVVHMDHKEASFKEVLFFHHSNLTLKPPYPKLSPTLKVQDVDKSWDNWETYADEIELRYRWRPEIPERLRREVELGNLPGKWMKKPPVGLGPI